MNVLSLFDGISCGYEALKRADIPVENYFASEIDKNCIDVAWRNHNNIKQMGDVSLLRKQEYEFPNFDLMIAGSPCFIAGTKVLTIAGYKNIEEINIGDLVLTHTGNWRRVLNTGNTISKTRIITGLGKNYVVTTDKHPFYIRTRYNSWNNINRRSERLFIIPKWKQAKKLGKNDFVGIVNTEFVKQKSNFTEHFWYMIGRYTGDGWYRKSKRKHRKNSFIYQFIICCGKSEFEELKSHFDAFGMKYNFSEERTGFKFRICSQKLVNFVEPIGKGAKNKIIHPFLFTETIENKLAFVNGLMDSDGHYREKSNSFRLLTTSYELALGFQKIIVDVYKTPASIGIITRPPTTIIEGRTVNQCTLNYTVSYKLDKRKQDVYFYDDKYAWLSIKSNKPTSKKERVYNLEVEIDNSYTANNFVVHNCQGFSQAGNQEGFNDPRSKLFFEFVRLLHEFKPRYFLLENVSMKQEFQDIISGHLGVQPVTINSSLVSAQNRKRLYWANFPITQPEDKHIRLSSILQSDYDRKYRLSERAIKSISKRQTDMKTRSGKSPTLTLELAHLWGFNFTPKWCFEIMDMRRCTPIEAERLQTLPDDYTSGFSDTTRYKMLGNCWTVDVISHIFKGIPK